MYMIPDKETLTQLYSKGDSMKQSSSGAVIMHGVMLAYPFWSSGILVLYAILAPYEFLATTLVVVAFACLMVIYIYENAYREFRAYPPCMYSAAVGCWFWSSLWVVMLPGQIPFVFILGLVVATCLPFAMAARKVLRA